MPVLGKLDSGKACPLDNININPFVPNAPFLYALRTGTNWEQMG